MPDSPHIPTPVLVALAVATLFVCGFASAADALGATLPEIVDDRPTPDAAVPAELQGKLGETPADAAAPLNAALLTKGDRKGAGFPSYKELLGKRWKAKVAKADRRFASRLDASEAPIGANGGRQLLGAGVTPDEFDRQFRISDQMEGKRGRQTRKLKVAAELDGGCPHPGEFGGFGWQGAGRATYEVTTTERAGRYDVVTAVVIDGHFRSRPDALDTAVAESFHIADYGEINITRNQVAIDRKTGKRKRIGETERFESTIDVAYKPDGDFLRFIMAQEDGKIVPPRPMRARVWDDVAGWFMLVPYDAMRSRVLEAEKLMRTWNRCVKLEASAGLPTHLAPGRQIELRGIPKLVDDPAVTPFTVLQETSRLPLWWIEYAGQDVQPLGKLHEMWNGRSWYRLTAPAAPWPADKPMGLQLGLISAAGVANLDATFEPESPAVHYEVLGASIETDTDASRPHSLCGEVGGSKSYTGSFEGAGPPEENFFAVDENGDIEGQVEADVTGLTHAHRVFGCDTRQSGDDYCETTLENRTKADSVWVGFSNAADPSKVRLDWATEDPEVGYQDAGNDECNAHVWGYFDPPRDSMTIDRSRLQGGEPITLTLGGSGHIDKHSGRDPASIDHTFEYSVTIQSVDE